MAYLELVISCISHQYIKGTVNKIKNASRCKIIGALRLGFAIGLPASPDALSFL